MISARKNLSKQLHFATGEVEEMDIFEMARIYYHVK